MKQTVEGAWVKIGERACGSYSRHIGKVGIIEKITPGFYYIIVPNAKNRLMCKRREFTLYTPLPEEMAWYMLRKMKQ